MEEEDPALRPDGRQLVYGVDIGGAVKVVAVDIAKLPKG
jgi:hypothetical protein